MEAEEIIRRMQIIEDFNEFIDTLMSCDGQVCIYTLEALYAGSCEYWVDKSKDDEQR